MNAQTSAETLALQAMGWIMTDAERAQAFMAATGASPADLATQAQEPAFLGAVLDFLLTEDSLITGFCDTQNLPYTAPMQARQHLPGFSNIHWT